MQDKKLFLLAIILAVVGLILLIILTSINEKTTNISEVNKLSLETKVNLMGKINNIEKSKDTTKFNITDETGTIKGIIFNSKSLKLTENKQFEIKGIVKTYKDSVEIHVNSIKET